MNRILISIITIFTCINPCFAQKDSVKNASKLNAIAVIPATVSFNLGAGQEKSQKIRVSNNLPERKNFKLYFTDWERDSLGGHVKYDLGTFSHSCARWLTLNKTAFALEPGETEEVTILMQVPDSPSVANEMKWTMLNCTTVEEKAFGPLAPNKLRAGIVQELEFGVHIYQTPPNVTNKSLKLISFSKDADKPGHYKVICQNTGDIQLQTTCYLELSMPSDKNGQKTKVGPRNFPLFPGQRRLVDFELPASLKKGKYVVIAAVDGGSDVPLEAAQGVIEVK